MSGLKPNAEKYFCLGLWKNKKNIVLDIPVEGTAIQILGVSISRCKTMKKVNFGYKLPIMNNQLKMYPGRDLSICGQVRVTKTFNIPPFVHSHSIIETDSLSENIIIYMHI